MLECSPMTRCKSDILGASGAARSLWVVIEDRASLIIILCRATCAGGAHPVCPTRFVDGPEAECPGIVQG